MTPAFQQLPPNLSASFARVIAEPGTLLSDQ